jgi:hypothetical protein
VNPLARVIAVVLLVGCAAPVSVSPSATTATSPPVATTAAASRTREPYRFALLYGETRAATQPTAISVLSLNGGVPRVVAALAPEHDGHFAIHPEYRSLAILDGLDHHLAHETTWRLRLVDLTRGTERDVIAETTEGERTVPRDVAWSSQGSLLIASRRSLDVVDVTSGLRRSVMSFAETTLDVTFQDQQHGALLVTQTAETISVYALDDSGVPRHVVDRPVVGYAAYAKRVGTDDILEVVTRYDGTVVFSLLRADSVREWTLAGPKVDGVVALAGTTAAAAYLAWPVAASDPAAFGVEGSAFLYRASYDASLETVAGMRNWGEFAPLGVSPDGRAVIVPSGERAQAGARFAIAVCCEQRPPAPLLDYGDRFVIGWIAER